MFKIFNSYIFINYRNIMKELMKKFIDKYIKILNFLCDFNFKFFFNYSFTTIFIDIINYDKFISLDINISFNLFIKYACLYILEICHLGAKISLLRYLRIKTVQAKY